MLKEFRFRNFKSFKNEETLSLEPMNNKVPELDCFNIMEKSGLLKTAVIYGHNSFGKTNLFKALDKMKDIILNCSNTNYSIYVDNFKLDVESRMLPSLFELTIIIEEVTYRYGFEVLNNKVIKEWLFKKNIREVNVFERDNSFDELFKISTSYASLNKYKKFTREEELFLSSMVKNNEQGEMKNIYDWIKNNIRIISGDKIYSNVTSELISENKLDKESVLKAIRNADINIQDLELKEEEENFENMPSVLKSILKDKFKDKDLSKEKFISLDELFKHNIYNNEEVCGTEEFNLLEKESQGTIKFYSLIGPILDSLKNGYTLFVDEMDSKLHHLLIKYIVDLFNSIFPNENNAQLIFNTHDFYLLKEEVFRKDQIYFTDKDKYGMSSLYSLADFKGIDKKTNLMAHYLSGNFGSLGDVKSGD